MKLTW